MLYKHKNRKKEWANASKDMPRMGYGKFVLEKKQKEMAAKLQGKTLMQSQGPNKFGKDRGEFFIALRTCFM